MQQIDLYSYQNYMDNHNDLVHQEYDMCDEEFDGYEYEDQKIELNDVSRRDVSCCPLEMLHKKRHSLSYKPNVKRDIRKADVSRIPKFRNPWDVQGEFQPRRSKDIPLSYEEARFIREIWQDTRAQYYPSDGEIEEEFLFEEEYDDTAAEKRRNSLIEKGANLVRYSRHYELPTISTIIKSTNPEQFRSRSFSPLGDRINKKKNSMTRNLSKKMKNLNQGIEEFNTNNDYYNTFNNGQKNCRLEELNNRHNYNKIYGRNINQGFVQEGESEFNEFDLKRSMDNTNFKTEISLNIRNNANEREICKNGVNRESCLFNVPSFSNINSSQRRNTTQGIYSDSNQCLKSSVTSRRATSPELLSPTKSTSRGPPPKIGILEPIETSEGLVSPVNQHKISSLNTPRIGGVTPKSTRDSRIASNLSKKIDIDRNNSFLETIPVISPTGKQTIVFHMIPDNENNSKATIFANPDTQNIVTELHITPGVDINVISTPNGPAIEYEISGGRNAKAHINFSSNPTPDVIMSTSDIPKIQPPNHSNNEMASSDVYTAQDQINLKISQTQKSPNRRSLDNINLNNFRRNMETTSEFYNQAFKDDNSNIKINSEKKNSTYQSIDQEDKHYMVEETRKSPNVGSQQEKFEEFKNEDISDQDHLLFDENDLNNEKEQNNELFSNKNINLISNTKSYPNPFIPVKRIQKRNGFTGCIINTLTCSKVEAPELKTFRALSPVEMVNRTSEYY